MESKFGCLPKGAVVVGEGTVREMARGQRRERGANVAVDHHTRWIYRLWRSPMHSSPGSHVDQHHPGSEDGAQVASHQPLKKWSNATGFRRTFGAGGRRLSPRFVNYLTASDDDVYKLSSSHQLEEGTNGVEKVVSADLLVSKEELTEGKSEASKGDADTALMAPPPPPPLSEERGVDVGRVGGWATSFEKLLEDPIGLHTFAEFLKKEFSAENIYFWVACERYRITPNDGTKNTDGKLSRRATMARDIFQRHLCLGAPEPVNVDSHARQETEEGLAAAEPTLFLQAQKQIFNLMKFDSYPRFLKSDLYKECLMRDMSGQSLSFGSNATLDADLCLHPNHDGDDEVLTGKLKKSRSDAEERRRKSLLPWHRKNRSKSKDRGETDYQKMRAAAAVVAAAQALLPNARGDDASSSRSDLASSRSSLASSDLALIQRGALARQSLTSSEWSAERVGSEGPSAACPLCRVILPDGATTVVNTDTSRSSSNQQQSSRQTIRDLVTRLLEKRGLKYSAFEVFFCDGSNDSSGKPLDLDEDIQVLGSREVRVERRVIFRVDLPSRKTIGVKSNPDRSLAQVLRPILHKYGYPLESVALCLMSENEVLDPSMPVTTADDEKIQVLTKSGEIWKTENGVKGINKADGGRQAVQGAPTLDEITNRVFEELLAGKVAEEKASSRLCNDEITSEDRASVRSEDWSSEHSSGIFGRFLRSDSAVMDKPRDSRCIKGKKGSMKKMKQSSSNDGMCSGSGGFPAVIRGNDFSVGSRIIPPAPRLKAGIRPPGRSDSDELYEGLKRAQRSRLEDQRGTEINFELPDFLKDKENAPQNTKKCRKVRREDERRFTFEPVDLGPKSPTHAVPLTSSAAFVSRLLDCSYSTDGIIPRQAERYFSTKSSLLPRCVSLPTTETSCGEYATDKSCDSLNITVVSLKSDSEESEKEAAKDCPSEISKTVEKPVDLKETVSATPCQLPESSTSQNKDEGSAISKSQPPLPISKPEISSAIGLGCPPRSSQRPDPPVPPPPRNNCDPPPLPPKPKNLPASVPSTTTSNSKVQPLLRSAPACKGWGTVNPTFCHSSGDEGSALSNLTSEKSVPLAHETVLASRRDPRVCRSRRAVYLDQPSSSFV